MGFAGERVSDLLGVKDVRRPSLADAHLDPPEVGHPSVHVVQLGRRLQALRETLKEPAMVVRPPGSDGVLRTLKFYGSAFEGH